MKQSLTSGSAEGGFFADDTAGPIDLEGLLCALVLVPGTYSRNRNFRMYQDPSTRAVLRRARLVRALVRELCRPDEKTIAVAPRDGGVTLTVEIPALQFKRQALLSPVEHDLVEYLLARSNGRRAEEAARRVELALARLALPIGAEPPEEECSGVSGS
jgi:hypothetical protein